MLLQKKTALKKNVARRLQHNGELKRFLDALVLRYKTPAFIPADPIRFPHRFRSDPQTCEWLALLSALLSYGRREKILETLEGILSLMNHTPADFLQNFSPKHDAKLFNAFVYRFNRGPDLVALLSRLQHIHQEYNSLESFYIQTTRKLPPESTYRDQLSAFMDAFIHLGKPPSPGLKFLLAHPARGGACKRLHMFLRWMVRQDDDSGVDLGLWKTALNPSQLLIPLDTHVAQMARMLRLTERQADNWTTAEEITAVLKSFSPEDPIQYDFALFGFNIQKGPDFHERP